MATTKCVLDITMLSNPTCIAYKDTNTGKQEICGNLTEFLNDLRETIGNMYIKCDNAALPFEDVRIKVEVECVPRT